MALTTRDDRTLASKVAGRRQEIQDRVKGKKVTILVGKYAGREAVIDAVMLDPFNGNWLFCCYVLRVDGNGYLNSDPESRSYRPAFEIHEVSQ